MIANIKNRIMQALQPTTPNPDTHPDNTPADPETIIYPITITGDIEIESDHTGTSTYTGMSGPITAIINADQSLTITHNHQILAYYPTETWDLVTLTGN